MADNRTFALPDSLPFKAYYVQQRRKKRKRESTPVDITQVFINLEPTASAHYSLASPWVAAGDFEIEFDVVTSAVGTRQGIMGGVADNTTYIKAEANEKLRIKGPNSGDFTSIGSVRDGKLNKCKYIISGGTASLYINGSFDSSKVDDWSGFSVATLGVFDFGIRYFNGIISNVKLTDLDTPSNSLEYGLDELTANTETSNGNVLTYENIATTTDVRDTYTLTDGDWIGSELVVNGDFATDSDWVTGTGWSIAGGVASNAVALTDLNQGGIIRTGTLNRLDFDVLSAGGALELNIWNGSKLTVADSIGLKTVYYTANVDRITFYLGAGSVTIDNVSVKRIIEVAP